MPDLTSLRSPIATTTIEYNGQEIHLEFRPDFYTPEIEAALSEAKTNAKPVAALADALEQCLVGWDITADGEVLPISAVRTLDVNLLNALALGVFSALSPNAQNSQD